MSYLTPNHRLRGGPLLALCWAFLFGASTPIAKLLLGIADPLLLAGLFCDLGAIRWKAHSLLRCQEPR